MKVKSKPMHKTALVLFSGGQDSTTCLALALSKYERVETVAFDYRQRHSVELEARLKVLAELKANGKLIGIDGGFLKEAGIEFAILSNNRSPVRVEKFCKPLKVGYVGHAGKPGTRGFHEAMARYGVNAGETAMLGDKLLTDTLGARRSGVLMLMVEPKGGPDGAWNHVLHALQEPFKRKSAHDVRQKGGNLEK